MLFSCSVVSNSVRPYGLWPARLLCPWNFPGKNTAVDFHALHQGLFLTHGLNPAGRFFTTELPWKPCGGISKQKYLADK